MINYGGMSSHAHHEHNILSYGAAKDFLKSKYKDTGVKIAIVMERGEVPLTHLPDVADAMFVLLLSYKEIKGKYLKKAIQNIKDNRFIEIIKKDGHTDVRFQTNFADIEMKRNVENKQKKFVSVIHQENEQDLVEEMVIDNVEEISQSELDQLGEAVKSISDSTVSKEQNEKVEKETNAKGTVSSNVLAQREERKRTESSANSPHHTYKKTSKHAEIAQNEQEHARKEEREREKADKKRMQEQLEIERDAEKKDVKRWDQTQKRNKLGR